MATLVIPLTQGAGSSDQYLYAPRNYAPDISAQHIYSVRAVVTYGYDVSSYTGVAYDDEHRRYTYLGPGNEPREEIPTYWNWILQYRIWGEGGTHTDYDINGAIKEIVNAPKAAFANKAIKTTHYIDIDLTAEQKALLAEHISEVYMFGADRWYQMATQTEPAIYSHSFVFRSADNIQLDPLVYARFKFACTSECYLMIEYLPTGSIKPPTNVRSPEHAPEQGVQILWDAPQKTETETWDVEIDNYAIWRCDTVDGTYTKVGETDGPVLNYTDTTATPGEVWYYKVQACSTEVPLYNSELSEQTAGTYVNYEPDAPMFESGADGCSYNNRPRILATIGTDEDNVMLALAAAGYTASRDSAPPGSKVVFQRTNALTADAEESVTVSETDPSGNVVSDDADVAYTVPTWTDVPIVAGTTIVKAVHINELRTQLENLCAYYGMAAPIWSEDVVAGTTPSYNFPTHATELQNVVRAIAEKINNWDPISSRCNVVLPSLIEPSRPLASVINQLRDIIKIL